MTREEKIYQRLESDYNLLIDKGYEVVGVFLQGSQNYKLDYEKSDIDTKAIILPSFEDILNNRTPISYTLILDSNEHIDIKDIRIMFDCFKKQNINFLEILYTNFYKLNPKYSDLYQRVQYNEDIARINNYSMIRCIAGVIYEKEHAMCHRFPSLADKIDAYGYDPKQLHHIVRCWEFMQRFFAGESFKQCLVPKDKEYLIKLKSIPPLYNLEDAHTLADDILDKVRDYKEKYLTTHSEIYNRDPEYLLDDVKYKIIKRYMKEQISKD